MQKLVISLSGVARSGKDSFCQYLIAILESVGIRAKRYAFADELKDKVRQPLIDLCGVDVLNCSPKDKEMIRDYLVAVGKIKRIQTNGKYWTGLVEEKIKNDSDVDVAIVTDTRYDVYPEDELWWVQEHMNGVLVHLRMYDEKENPFEDSKRRNYVLPPNKDEAENDPKLHAKADYKVEWSRAADLSKLEEHCYPYIEGFIHFLYREGFLKKSG